MPKSLSIQLDKSNISTPCFKEGKDKQQQNLSSKLCLVRVEVLAGTMDWRTYVMSQSKASSLSKINDDTLGRGGWERTYKGERKAKDQRSPVSFRLNRRDRGDILPSCVRNIL